jgi:hypothetical protein
LFACEFAFINEWLNFTGVDIRSLNKYIGQPFPLGIHQDFSHEGVVVLVSGTSGGHRFLLRSLFLVMHSVIGQSLVQRHHARQQDL